MSKSTIDYLDYPKKTYVEWYKNNTSEPNEKFLAWISKVEKKIMTKLSLSLIDLPDEDYIMYFEENITPNDMVKIIYESNGLM